MKSPILLGPILGIESNDLYTICLLTDKSVNSVEVTIYGEKINASKMDETVTGVFWRTEYQLEITTEKKLIDYSIKIDNEMACDKNKRTSWKFYVPSIGEQPKFAYTSCNGFSDEGLKEKTSNPYLLWETMAEQHSKSPYSLLLMGGDQLYADSIWGQVNQLSEWSNFSKEEKIPRKRTKDMAQQIDKFYDLLYQNRWSNPDMSLMLASVPSVMMWDDHDIFDGWGSYPEDIQECDVYQCIFEHAKKYFELFQIRTINNKSLINPGSTHYAFSFSFRNYHILAIDNRSERTLKHVMSTAQWDALNVSLNNITSDGDLLLLTAVPVVYRDFSFTESVVDSTPWEEALTDDLKDHWRAKEHQGERARLIMNLLDNTRKRKGRTVMLSGDIHIGCLGVINDRSANDDNVKIHQIVSSGIVHPSPSMIEWYGIMAVTNDRDEYLNEDNTIKVSMLKPHGSNKYIRSRNFVTLQEGTDNKLWVNWICEGKDNPTYPLE